MYIEDIWEGSKGSWILKITWRTALRNKKMVYTPHTLYVQHPPSSMAARRHSVHLCGEIGDRCVLYFEGRERVFLV